MKEFKVGLFTLATFAALVFMAFKITSRQGSFGNYISYKTIVRDASGIFEKSPIKVAGINAGRIKRIQLYDERALITFEILSTVKVTQGSKLKIKTIGLLGEKYIDILLNKESKERLLKDSIIPSEEEGGFDTLAKDASDILNDVKDVMANIKESIGPDKDGGPLPLQIIIQNLRLITENLAYELDSDNQESLMAGVRKISPVLDDVKKHDRGPKSGHGEDP